MVENELDKKSSQIKGLVDALYDKNCFLIVIASTDFKEIYNGEHWKFEFERTVSRITEMSQF